ncbi:beta-glucoside-specific PTS transporter subunit IIABC [Paenibacillus kribbensis]|uniref:beta-glucoside-specific PTS transporter subunit IIABC n=1 Tax=Paenibacillus kribbensis TaxID=172713 RepID=UPI0008397A81|nr:beta-glucoside-specific PTS transporter subunit IIABC [Paenibacillus kribbensis]
MNNEQLASKILQLVGGANNVDHVVHCYTRLRFNLKDDNRAEKESIEKLDGVITVQEQSGQFQIVIGNNVGKVYNELIKLADISPNHPGTESNSSKKKQNIVSRLMETIAGIFTPVIPAIAGAGILKGLLGLITALKWAESGSDSMRILALVADSVFYFLPFFLAVSAARKFKTSEFMALGLAGGLMYPTIMDAAKSIAAGKVVEPISFMGMPVGLVNYSSTVIPIILSVWILSYVYRLIDRFMPTVVKSIFTPTLALLIMIPIELIVIGPMGSYLGVSLANGVSWLFEHVGFLAGMLLGGTRPLLVMVGMHYGLMPIAISNLATIGFDYLLPIFFVSNMGQMAAAFAVFLKTKNKSFKAIAASTSFSALLGITEPAMYGVNLKLKKPFIAALIGSGMGGAFLTIFHVKSYGFVLPGITALPVFIGPEFIYLIIGTLITVVSTIVLTYIFGFEDVPGGDTKEASSATVTPDKKWEPERTAIEIPESNLSMTSPINGTIVPLKDVPDQAFSQGAMGKGVGIEPSEGKIYAPFDGTIETVFRTKHVIAMKSLQGVEILIHIGIDTVKLQGQHFDVFVDEGQKIKAGDLLMEFNLEEIRKAGYPTVTPIIVTNSMDYTDVIVLEQPDSQASTQKPLLAIMK